MSSVGEQPDRLDYCFHYSQAEARANLLPVRRFLWVLWGGAFAAAVILTIVLGAMGTGNFAAVGILVAIILVVYLRLVTLPRKVVAAADGRPVRWRVGPEGVEVETAAGSARIDWSKVVWVWLTPSALTLRRRDPAIRFRLPRRVIAPADQGTIAQWALQAGVRRRGDWTMAKPERGSPSWPAES